MPPLILTEYVASDPVELSHGQVAALSVDDLSITISPAPAAPGKYTLTPGSKVGAVTVGDLEIVIRPKIDIQRLLFLVAYAMDPKAWQDTCRNLAGADSLVEAIAPVFARLVAKATCRGLLRGYRSLDDRCPTIRGQIRMSDVVRLRFGLMPPVEVTYDDFTANIPENEILVLALDRLSRFRMRSQFARDEVSRVGRVFGEMDVPRLNPARLPAIQYNRLNEHYRPAIRLAELILSSTSFDLGSGGASATCFLLDMNRVFEGFVHRALQEHLRLSDAEFPKNDGRLRMDIDGMVRLEPDLSWWRSGRCLFVGDVKYKRIGGEHFKNGDLYQLLSYVVAADLPSGSLIYAKGEQEPASLTVRHVGRRLDIWALDLSKPPEGILEEVGRIAGSIRIAQLTGAA